MSPPNPPNTIALNRTNPIAPIRQTEREFQVPSRNSVVSRNTLHVPLTLHPRSPSLPTYCLSNITFPTSIAACSVCTFREITSPSGPMMQIVEGDPMYARGN